MGHSKFLDLLKSEQASLFEDSMSKQLKLGSASHLFGEQKMIFELFISLILCSCIFIFIGYYTDIKILAVLGFATFFFLGLLLQFNGVTIRNGSTDAYTYLCYSCTGDSVPSLAGNTSTISSIITSYNYDTINDSTSVWIGRWLSIVSALGVALVLASNRREDD
jgi:hypothetical protein